MAVCLTLSLDAAFRISVCTFTQSYHVFFRSNFPRKPLSMTARFSMPGTITKSSDKPGFLAMGIHFVGTCVHVDNGRFVVKLLMEDGLDSLIFCLIKTCILARFSQ